MKAILEINRMRVSWLTERIDNISEDTLSTLAVQQSTVAQSADLQ